MPGVEPEHSCLAQVQELAARLLHRAGAQNDDRGLLHPAAWRAHHVSRAAIKRMTRTAFTILLDQQQVGLHRGAPCKGRSMRTSLSDSCAVLLLWPPACRLIHMRRWTPRSVIPATCRPWAGRTWPCRQQDTARKLRRCCSSQSRCPSKLLDCPSLPALFMYVHAKSTCSS